MLNIIIIGPKGTGKTTLCFGLLAYFIDQSTAFANTTGVKEKTEVDMLEEDRAFLKNGFFTIKRNIRFSPTNNLNSNQKRKDGYSRIEYAVSPELIKNITKQTRFEDNNPNRLLKIKYYDGPSYRSNSDDLKKFYEHFTHANRAIFLIDFARDDLDEEVSYIQDFINIIIMKKKKIPFCILGMKKDIHKKESAEFERFFRANFNYTINSIRSRKPLLKFLSISVGRDSGEQLVYSPSGFEDLIRWLFFLI